MDWDITGGSLSPYEVNRIGNVMLSILRRIQKLRFGPPVGLRFFRFALSFAAGMLLASPWASIAMARSRQAVEQMEFLRQQIPAAQKHLGSLPQMSEQVEQFYQGIGFKLAWLQNDKPTPQARSLIALFQNSQRKGLVAADYGDWAKELEALHLANGDGMERRAQFDLDLTVAAMRYVSDLHFGRVSPETLSFALGPREQNFKLAEFLRDRITDGDDIPRAIESVEPPYPGYKRTLAALQTLQQLSSVDESRPLAIPKTVIYPGDAFSQLPQLAARLQQLGDFEKETPVPSDLTYRGAIVRAVQHFQSRHALQANGNLDRPTMEALNVPLKKRIEQLELTLERWRWVPQQLDRPLIIVNIPEFELHAVDENYHWTFSQRVVLGRAYQHKTPVFIGQMQSVIFRPYWNVPLSIQRTEIIPHLLKNPKYLAQHDYEIVARGNTPVSLSALTEGAIHALKSGEWKVRQLPGAGNALGLIKFNFPNQYDVYMHGTPSPELFKRSRRDFSHGCIRVENPTALAAWVLHADSRWTPQAIDTAINGEQTITVALPHPLTVIIIYGTAVVPENGEVHFLPDIYGYDARLKTALERLWPLPHS